jgi:hypothetical protein
MKKIEGFVNMVMKKPGPILKLNSNFDYYSPQNGLLLESLGPCKHFILNRHKSFLI